MVEREGLRPKEYFFQQRSALDKLRVIRYNELSIFKGIE